MLSQSRQLHYLEASFIQGSNALGRSWCDKSGNIVLDPYSKCCHGPSCHVTLEHWPATTPRIRDGDIAATGGMIAFRQIDCIVCQDARPGIGCR
jgi:hypothetical protein